MERRTRSGRVAATNVTPPIVAPSKRGRKKKSEITKDEVESEPSTSSIQPVVMIPTNRRRGRPKNLDQSMISEYSETSISEIEQSNPMSSFETSEIVDESMNESVSNVTEESKSDDVLLQPKEEIREVEVDENSCDTVEMQSEPQIEDEIKVENEPPTEDVVNLEEKLSSVTIEEEQLPTETIVDADVDMGDREVKPEPEEIITTETEKIETPISEIEEKVVEEIQNIEENELPKPTADKTAIDIKDEALALQESLYDFQDDIEMEGNYVRRSRRLQSTYIEQIIKIDPREDEITTKLEIVKPEKPKEDIVQNEKPLEPQFRSAESEARLKKYETIRDNIVLKKSEKKNKKEANKTMKCDCTITEKNIRNGEMGCQFNCLNRLLYIECSTKCRCGAYCDNQQFQRYNYAPCSVFETLNKGFGIRADEDIPGDTFLIEYVGEVLDNKQFEKRAKKYSENQNEHFYFMALKTNSIIDATKKGNISRFINHSCDPNAETQKWTVNGELRVGFFSVRDIKKGEEIVFDYQYQRYGKEAQKCYCGSSNCRGWIGENPLEDEDDENEEIVEEVSKKIKAKKGRKPKVQSEIPDNMEQEETKKEIAPPKERKKRTPKEDLDVEAKINDLERTGIKNNLQTIDFARVFQRVKTVEARSRMIKILQQAAEPCLRLFMDYRGLVLLSSNWMSDMNVKSSIPDLELCIEIMKALTLLPIFNKTIVKNTKVFDRIEKWKNLDLEQKKMSKEERKKLKEEKKKNKLQESTEENVKSETAEETLKALESIDEEILDDLAKLKVQAKRRASELLITWEALKEDFKIPRKAKQDIMYQHQLQADENNWDENTTSTQRPDPIPIDRYKNRFRNDPNQNSQNRQFSAPFKKQNDNQLSKMQRRQAFEMEIEQKTVEKKMTGFHEKNCLIFGLNPYSTTPLDVPVRVNRVTGEYITIDGRVVPPPPNHHNFKYEPMTLSTNPDDYYLPPMDLPEHWRYAIDEYGRIYYYHVKIRVPQWEVPLKILPLTLDESDDDSPESDESTTETEDSEEEELKQLLEFLKRKKTLSPVAHSSNTSLSIQPLTTGDDEDELEKKILNNMIRNPADQPVRITQIPEKRKKKKRHGLTTMQFIKPRSEADKIAARNDNKKYKVVKEKLRQKKKRILKGEIKPGDESSDDDEDDIELNDIDKTKFVDELEILEKNSNKKKLELEKKVKKPKAPVMDINEMKRQFRDEIKIEVVKYLQPYREESCEKGKITSDEDFESLASKVTYSVLIKEQKYCQTMKNAIMKASDSVKLKTREYIKKYMSKFEGPYHRKEDEEDYASILNKI